MQPHPVPNKNRVLVVEDDPLAREFLKLYLDQEGYSYGVATNGKEALELCSKEFYPIIITDRIMPEMGGIELCRAIRERQSDNYIYIIMITSMNSSDDLLEGLAAGADEYLFKPVNQAELSMRLKSANRILTLESNLQHKIRMVEELTIRDHLTRVYNRNYMDLHLTNEIKRAYRYEHPLSVIMVDIDHFKRVNDTYGHQAGDEAIRSCAECICRSVRDSVDWVVRYGGEEFMVVLPETDSHGSLVVAERIRTKIAAKKIEYHTHTLGLTVSLGVATMVPSDFQHPLSPDVLLRAADQCLYQAKHAGRNRVFSIQI